MSFPKLEPHGEIAREYDAEGNPYSDSERQPARFRAVVRIWNEAGEQQKNRSEARLRGDSGDSILNSKF